MLYVRVEVLHNLGRPHESLVVIIHARQKCERIMVSKHRDWQRPGPEVYFKVLECPQQSKGFLFKGGVVNLALIKLSGHLWGVVLFQHVYVINWSFTFALGSTDNTVCVTKMFRDVV